jgi:ABC-type transport system involved in multi-copper enzyme maturation permease subunit
LSGMNWVGQLRAVAKVEWLRSLRGRRWIAPCVLAVLPNVVMLLPPLFGMDRGYGGEGLRRIPIAYTQFFQTLWLRLIIFFSCVSVFSQLFRSEFLEKTLHHYYLVPIRREAVVLGKYLTMLSATVILFSTSTASTYFLFFWPSANGRDFLLTGLGISHMFHYVAIAVLACAAYGALFLLIGLTFRNPMIPALFVLCWETFNYTMPSLFQHLSVILYLQSFMPVSLLGGPFAISVEPPTSAVSAAILLTVSVAIVAACGYIAKHNQITYSAE